MNTIRAMFSVAALGASLAGTPAAFAAGGVIVAINGCAGGFHADAQGNCQPDAGYVDNRCPPGYEASPFPNGNDYHCVPSGG